MRINNEDEYFKYFVEKEKNKSLEKALKIALDTRKFEIELYWKRANYFWLFIAAVFIAFYTTLDSDKSLDFENILIAFLGYTFSVCWLCVNRGSKFWQENWETNIELLSVRLGYPIFGLIACDEYSTFNPRDKYAYSVSKVNQVLNCTVIIAWVVLIVSRIVQITKDAKCDYAMSLWILISLIGLFCIYMIIHFFSKSFVNEKKKKLGTDTILFYKYSSIPKSEDQLSEQG